MIFEVAKDRLADDPGRARTRRGRSAPGQARLRVDAFGLTAEQRHLRRVRRGDAVLGLLPHRRARGLGLHPGLGLRRGRRVHVRRVRRRRAPVRLPPDGARSSSIEPGRADARGLVRRRRAPGTDGRARTTATRVAPPIPATTPAREAQQMLLYPLFFTSFVVDDFFDDHDDFGTDVTILSSASSKTAIGIAFLAHRRGRRVRRPHVGAPSRRSSSGSASTTTSCATTSIAPTRRDGGLRRHVGQPRRPPRGARGVRRPPRALDGRRRHALGPRRPATADDAARARARVLLRAHPDREAQRRLGPGRARPSHAPRRGRPTPHWTDGWLEPTRGGRPDAVGAAYAELLAGGTDPRTGYVCALSGRGSDGVTARRARTPTVASPDGRLARRDRNRTAVLDAMLALFTEGDLDPSPEQVAARAGISPRSVYRYFDDREALLRGRDRPPPRRCLAPLRVPRHRRGSARRAGSPTSPRTASACTRRSARPPARPGCRAATDEILREQLELTRRALREQIEKQFAPELDAHAGPTSDGRGSRRSTRSCELEALDHYRTAPRRSPTTDTEALLADALRALLTT